MKANKLFVVSDRVSKFKDEVYQYVWNERSGEPEKHDDDVLDALRYAIYSEEIMTKQKNNGNQFDTLRAGFGL